MSAWLNHIGLMINSWTRNMDNADALLIISGLFLITLPIIMVSSYVTSVTINRIQDRIAHMLRKSKFRQHIE